ncbi:hypothetical protein CAOG_03445 [Capsaspora owczarzaki ATCC 30864]|nr:hypothetical protein CAOG_03445 [Capsaspora owczarzaki ATCC 30864]|eukprot:XP_004364284.2 hypothetical protein CAOG_03445 [Capsaspora owczarzaki ATCC 30864]
MRHDVNIDVCYCICWRSGGIHVVLVDLTHVNTATRMDPAAGFPIPIIEYTLSKPGQAIKFLLEQQQRNMPLWDEPMSSDPISGSGSRGSTASSLVVSLSEGEQQLMNVTNLHGNTTFAGQLALKGDNTRVVVKFSDGKYYGQMEQLVREGMALALLGRAGASEHNLPVLLSFCEATLNDTKGFALVTHCLSGTTLEWWAHQAHAEGICAKLRETLQWVHSQGIVHGDIHRGNVLVTIMPPSPPRTDQSQYQQQVSVSVALIDFGLCCFRPEIATPQVVKVALEAAPVTAPVLAELKSTWLGRVAGNSWDIWPGHFYAIARSKHCCTPRADFLSLSLLMVAGCTGGSLQLQFQLYWPEDVERSESERMKRALLRDRTGSLARLMKSRGGVLREVCTTLDSAEAPEAMV